MLETPTNNLPTTTSCHYQFITLSWYLLEAINLSKAFKCDLLRYE